MKIEFENGSSIESIDNISKSKRSKRAEDQIAKMSEQIKYWKHNPDKWIEFMEGVGEIMLEKGTKMECANCYWFNGEKGDGCQFCDEREEDVYENGYCSKWQKKDCYDI